MASIRSKVARYVPPALLPYGRRMVRRVDQVLGYPSSDQRPGVVLMLHVGRCGSTVLANLLDQNPGIYWDGKLYRKAVQLYDHRDLGIDYPQWTRRQFYISGSRYYGFEFKILRDQYPALINASLSEFLAQCKSIGVTHYILLTRRNTLRHLISHYASKKRGNWHISGSESVRRLQFELDMQDISTGSGKGRPLISYLQEVDDAHDQVRDILQDQLVLEIEYEGDIEERGALFAYEKICDFLRLEPGDVKIKNKRINPFSIRETILNYDEIAEELRDTRFEWMLEESDGR